MTTRQTTLGLLQALLILTPVLGHTQVPVDDDGNVIGEVQSGAEIVPVTEDGIPRLTFLELQELVGPVALYPDDLLAVVLPASAYPLQIAAAARFLEAREQDSSLEPNPDWDDAVVALLNYPEVLELMDSDLDWTYRLGEAVVAQQGDVVAAVEAFRDRAYAAGNLKSDEYQTIDRTDDVIRITPVADDAIYVPYYEPERVVVYQPRPVYYYYPRSYPVYYYPYSSAYHFDRGYFWGVTTAFSIGWISDSVHVYHHSYRGHPYYGRHYRNDWWYRRPSINIYNTTYVNRSNVHRYTRGDRWIARDDRPRRFIREGYARDNDVRRSRTVGTTRSAPVRTSVTRERETIRFRERPDSVRESSATPNRTVRRENSVRRESTARRESPARHESAVRRDTTTRRESTARRETSTRRESTARRETSTRRESTARRESPVRSQSTVRRETTVRREAPARRTTQSRRETTRSVREPSRSSRPSTSVRRESSRPARQERSASERRSRNDSARRSQRKSDRQSRDRERR